MDQDNARSDLDCNLERRTIWFEWGGKADSGLTPSALMRIEESLKAIVTEGGTRSIEEAATWLSHFWLGAPSDVAQQMSAMRFGRIVERHPVFDGYVDVVLSEPVVSPSRTPNLYFSLLTVPGIGELMRENHGSGYHFHFSDDGRRRADILLTFTRVQPEPVHPVTWEPHAVGSADFKANVAAWGKGKRSGVHTVCMSDRQKRKLTDYLRPSGNSNFLLP